MTLHFNPRRKDACDETVRSADKVKRASDNGESRSPRGRSLQERLNDVELQIEAYVQFDSSEKDRFNRESLLWTAEDRIEWQETRLDTADRLRELLNERYDLQDRLRT